MTVLQRAAPNARKVGEGCTLSVTQAGVVASRECCDVGQFRKGKDINVTTKVVVAS